MTNLFLCLTFVLVIAPFVSGDILEEPKPYSGCCYRPFPKVNGAVPELVTSPLPWTDPNLRLEHLPRAFDWRLVNGTVFTTPVTAQAVPKFCGSCWAHGALALLADRLKIQRFRAGQPVTDFRLSVQRLLDCASQGQLQAGSCNGGSEYLTFQWIRQFGMVEETCYPYTANDYQYNGEDTCQGPPLCRVCDRFNTCGNVPARRIYGISEFGTIPTKNVEAMMKEIYVRGPIATSMYAHNPLFVNYTGGVLQGNACKAPYITHVVAVVGWGVEAGVDYWVVRNSFGTEWGENGFFRIQRGVNCMFIETAPCWAVPNVTAVPR